MIAALGAGAPWSHAGEFTVVPMEKLDLKSVFGRVESRNLVEARARIGGSIVSLDVEEGTAVKAGDVVATVVDDKLAIQLGALDSKIKALEAEFQNAQVELERGKSLLAAGTVPKSRVDALQTQVEVLSNQIAAARGDRAVVVQQGAEGQVIAPAPGRVLTVPVTKGSVVLPGETIARIAGGGYFLRLSLPERHAAVMAEGDEVYVGRRNDHNLAEPSLSARKGKIVKVYPEIEGGRVLADVEVSNLGDFFVGERTLVWIPVEKRKVLAVPPDAVSKRFGIDYVSIANEASKIDVAVIVGEVFETADGKRQEILSGLLEGDKVLLP
jgi:RND family efflux transporter MFP subunit